MSKSIRIAAAIRASSMITVCIFSPNETRTILLSYTVMSAPKLLYSLGSAYTSEFGRPGIIGSVYSAFKNSLFLSGVYVPARDPLRGLKF